MNDEILTSILLAPFEIDFLYEGPLAYRAPDVEMPGTGFVRATRDAVEAELTESESALARLAASGYSGEAPSGFGLRNPQPGVIVAPDSVGTIAPPDDSWYATGAIQHRHRWSSADLRSTYNFSVGSLIIRGPSNGPAALRRFLYRGSHVEFEAACLDAHIVARSPTGKQASPLFETVTVGVAPPFTETRREEALWLFLSLVTGNRLQQLAAEDYDGSGVLVSRTVRIGNRVSEGREEPFHSRVAPLTGEGAVSILSGIDRLLAAGFPIDVAIHHLTDANTGYIDSDATHLILALHCCLEAWNRNFGFDKWIDDCMWEPFAQAVRHTMFRPTFYDDVGPDMKANLASALRHANRTTTSWRQDRFFEALGFSLSVDDERALAVRDEILHNGYFLRRWFDLSPEERQTRLDDIKRLRNLAMASILKLCGFRGVMVDHLRYGVAYVEKAELSEPLRG